MDLNEMIKSLITMYYEYYPTMEPIAANVVFTDSLNKTHCELRTDRKERLLAAAIESDDDYNGRMVMPHEIDGNIHILLNTNKVIEYTEDQSMTWVGTLAHELTHAIDYYQMARKECLSSYDPLEETDQYLMFQLWSEYHARKFGYGFLRKVLGADDDARSKQEHAEYITKTELTFHAKRHFDEYHNTQNGNLQMYSAMQLLGRYSVWCDLYPEWFNKQALKASFANNPWMYNLFSFLRSHETLDAVYNNFSDMRLVLKENWAGL